MGQVHDEDDDDDDDEDEDDNGGGDNDGGGDDGQSDKGIDRPSKGTRASEAVKYDAAGMRMLCYGADTCLALQEH